MSLWMIIENEGVTYSYSFIYLNAKYSEIESNFSQKDNLWGFGEVIWICRVVTS